jgi:5-deoxy-glucuronate isomerase
MSEYIVPSSQVAGTGRQVQVTPESAGWEYVGFEAYKLDAGQKLEQHTGNQELCIVLLSGLANFRTDGQSFEGIGKRMSVFERIPPYAVYIPDGKDYRVEAVTDLHFALCTAPGKSTYGARLIKPEEIGVETRGAGHMERYIHNILPEQAAADSLLVVEVFTPQGHWSSYPPHKHDANNLPHESYLEETYYHMVEPADGFAIQRVYTDDRSLDETLTVRSEDVVLVPKGYHPVSAPPGYDLYYLNVMAGPVRTWKFHNDPQHEWLFSKMTK